MCSFSIAQLAEAKHWLANAPLSIMNGAIYHLPYTSGIVALIFAAQDDCIGK